MSDTRRVAVVTGGAKRVGKAIVERLADAGYDIAFTYRSSEDEATLLSRNLAEAGRLAVAIKADLSKPAEAAWAIEKAVTARFGRLDVLVNSASAYKPGDLQGASIDEGREAWAIHVEAPLLLCRRFEKYLREARGHVINMVDLLAERPWPEYLLYSASKAALANLTLGLARELAPEVTVNGIAPGVVEWPDDYPPEEKGKYLKRVPLAREGTPRDVAELVHYLCTAGNYITGQIIRLDGGRSTT